MHTGHRRRMIDKLINKRKTLSDHEILEIALFYCIPRQNVNEISHNLLDSFGSLSNILKSEPMALTTIDGVGLKTAEFIVALGEFFLRASKEKSQAQGLFNFESCKAVLKLAFKNITKEVFMALYLDKSGNLIFRKIFCSHSVNNVDINLNELLKGVDAVLPESVIICHNHLSGLVLPSNSDDEATRQIYKCLKSVNVRLNDHIIVSGDKFFSYYSSGHFEEVFKEKND